MLLLLGNCALGKSTGPLSEFPPPRESTGAVHNRHCRCVLLSSWLLLAEESIDLVSESALHHSTDTAHPQHKAAPQLPVSSSVPCARTGEMKRWSCCAKWQWVPRLQQQGRIWKAKIPFLSWRAIIELFALMWHIPLLIILFSNMNQFKRFI